MVMAAGPAGTGRADGADVIVVTLVDGQQAAVNADLIARVDDGHRTLVTLVDGTTYTVMESVGEIMSRVRDFRASVLVAARSLEADARPPRRSAPGVGLRAVPDPDQR
jgi:flagellar protein FlbD